MAFVAAFAAGLAPSAASLERPEVVSLTGFVRLYLVEAWHFVARRAGSSCQPSLLFAAQLTPTAPCAQADL